MSRGYLASRLLETYRENKVVLGVSHGYATVLSIYSVQPYLTLIYTNVLILAGAYALDSYFRRLESSIQQYFMRRFLEAGHGLTSRGILRLVNAIRINTYVLIATLAQLGLHVDLLPLLLLAVVFSTTLVILMMMPRILVYFWVSNRRTSLEIELPYVLVMLRVLSSLRLPIYEYIDVMERSRCFRALNREIEIARKISSLKSVSIVTAIEEVISHHPSKLARDVLTRVFGAVSSIGDIKDIVDRVFDTVFRWFENKVSGLVEKFTLITGASILFYFFLPVVFASIIPIYFGAEGIYFIIIVLSLQVLVFFSLYSLISSIYPSSLALRARRLLILTGALSLSASISMILFDFTSLLVHRTPLFDRNILILAISLLLIPSMVISENEIRRRRFQDRFIDVASDALNITATTGANPVSSLVEIAGKHGKKMSRYVRGLISGLPSDTLKFGYIARAPTLYHSSFIEILGVMYTYGWSRDAIQAFTHYYERIKSLGDRLASFSSTLEYLLVAISAMIGGFLEFIYKIYMDIEETTKNIANFMVYARLVEVELRVFFLIESITLISIIMVSVIISKVRSGRVFFMYRPAVLMLLLYLLSKRIVSLFLGMG